MKKQTGFTLIEIMIALLLGLIVVGATITIYITTIRVSSDIAKSARLNHDLESVMMLMTNDIKRTGYWGGATDGVAYLNPFTTGTANIQISGNCILYTYDANNNGQLTPADQTDDINADEYYGFKLENNSIKVRKVGDSATAASCSTANQWEEFVDSNQLKITELTFSFAPLDDPTDASRNLIAKSRCLNQTNSLYNPATGQPPPVTDDLACTGGANGDYITQNRVVNIRLVGKLKNDPTVTKTLLGSVEVRNNRICKWDGATCP